MMSHELRPFEPASAYGLTSAPQVQTIDLRRVLVMLRRQRVTILLPAVLLGGLGLAYALAKPPTYTASASLLLDANVNRSVRQAGGIDGGVLTQDVIENARVVLGSDKLAFDVLDRTGLQDSETFMDPPRSGFTTAIGQAAGTLMQPVGWVRDQVLELAAPAGQGETADATPAPPVLADSPVDPERRLAAARLRSGIDVERVGRSTAVAVQFRSSDPLIAAEVANAYADAYVQDILTANADSVGRTNEWMQSRLQKLQAQAQEAADAAERFSIENGLIASTSGGLLSEQALNEVNASLTAAMSDTARAQAMLDTYEKAVANGVEGLLTEGNALALGGEMSDSLRSRLDNYNDIRSRLQRLTQGAGAQSAQAQGLRRTLTAAAERLFVELKARRDEARSELNVANARVQALRDNLDAATARNSSQAADLVRLRALQQEAQTLSALYQATLTRSQEIEQQQSFPVSNVRILSYAQVPTSPSGPALLRLVAAAALVGLFLGLAAAALREMRERFLRTASDVTDHSALRFLGHLPVLPRVRRPQPAASKPLPPQPPGPVSEGGRSGGTLPVVTRPSVPLVAAPVPVLHYPSSVYAETLRHIRMAAETRAGDPAVIGVTSFHPYPGRSSVSLNLAGQMGLGMQSVLLIDADARGRALSRTLGLDEKPGLLDAVTGRGRWQDMLARIAGTNVTVLPCGLAGGGESDDLLTNRLLRQMLEDAGEEFGCIVVDVPPLYPVVQGRAILREMPRFVIVGEWGRTPRSMAETALADHPELEARCLGVVYDRVNLRRLRSFLMPEAMENYLGRSKEYLSLRRR